METREGGSITEARRRTVLHVDMNAFFASIEQRANPALRGRPIAVVGSSERTVVTTASYEARAFGVKTGMNKYEAKLVCPSLTLVVGDNKKYIDASVRMLSVFERFTPMVEVFSIDEVFMDVTGSRALFGTPERIAAGVKEGIREELGITCSIGIGPNKLVAKLASGMEKPDGLVRIREEEVRGVFRDLPISELCGIGRKLEAHLASMGITTCGELAAFSPGLLRQRFGIAGERLVNMARGEDLSPVVPAGSEAALDGGVKSIGHSMTLPSDISDPAAIRRQILKLSEMVARRARRHGLKGGGVALTVRYPDFYTFSRQKKLSGPTDDARVISRGASGLLGSVGLKGPVRLLGVTLYRLIKNPLQGELFSEDQRREALLTAMDRINDRFGDLSTGQATGWATLFLEDDGPGVISPSWRPGGVKRIDVK